jgi:hypothetical protein
MPVPAKTLKIQEREARRLLCMLVKAQRRDSTSVTGGALEADALTQHLNQLEVDLHEIGHVVALFDGWYNAREQELRYHRMRVSEILDYTPHARTKRERLRQERAADQNEIETIAFTWLTLGFLGHEVAIEPLIDFAVGTLEASSSLDLKRGVLKAVRSTRIRGWAKEVAELVSSRHTY